MADATLTLFQVTPPAATVADVLAAIKDAIDYQAEIDAILFEANDDAWLFAA